MKARTLTLVGALAVGQSVGVGQPVPVPAQGPPGAVPALGMPRPFVPPAGAFAMEPGTGAPVPAPLVAAKFVVPKDVRVTAYPGSGMSRIFDAPNVIGLRPGYSYRFELSNLPYHPGVSLYPEVEVRGTLVPRPGMKYMDYPLPITLSQLDIDRVLKGVVITKVLYLEDPEKALPAEVGRDAPVETPDASDEVAIKTAIANGRLMAIVRVGNRRPTGDLLQATAVAGTILLPGERQLRAPVAPPMFRYYAQPMYDPILGPAGPKEECFVDGGDKGDPLGITPSGNLGGLNPTDVGVEFTLGGKRKVTTSNVVCICSPRFMVRRVEIVPGGIDHTIALAGHVGVTAPGLFRDRRAAMADIGIVRPGGIDGSVRPSVYVGKLGTSFFIGSTRPLVVGQVSGVKVTAALVEPEQLTAYPNLCPLTVTKSVDPPGPKSAGDIVTITIKYANTGSREVSDIVVSDSLSGRLEYVPGSAVSDRAANFSVGDNEVGSSVVRWELPGTILPGQSGTVKFKAKVR